jgi:hypothetical protein
VASPQIGHGTQNIFLASAVNAAWRLCQRHVWRRMAKQADKMTERGSKRLQGMAGMQKPCLLRHGATFRPDAETDVEPVCLPHVAYWHTMSFCLAYQIARLPALLEFHNLT